MQVYRVKLGNILIKFIHFLNEHNKNLIQNFTKTFENLWKMFKKFNEVSKVKRIKFYEDL